MTDQSEVEALTGPHTAESHEIAQPNAPACEGAGSDDCQSLFADAGLTLNQRKFLGAFAVTGNVCRAAIASECSRRSHYHWMESSEQYRDAFALAQQLAGDALEGEAVRRATVGTEEPVFQGGKLVGHITRYSDTLLVQLLRAWMPHKYKATIEHSGHIDQEPRVVVFIPDNNRDSLPADAET